MKIKFIYSNKKAYFNYDVIDIYIAGIVLTGDEIKSLRLREANISESFCQVIDNEVFMVNSYIKDWDRSTKFSKVDETRQRKLLLNKQEIDKLKKGVERQGYTIVPLQLFCDDNGRAKVKIALCKGKHNYDKREDIKKRDIEREISRNFK
jgi:SsrA-binding protein